MPDTPTSAADHIATLASGRWFAALPPELAGALAGMAHMRALQPGQALFLRGDPPCGLYAVVRGAIDISGVGGPDPNRAPPCSRGWSHPPGSGK